MLDRSTARKAPSDTREAQRVALACSIGTTIEWYDFFIYGTAAAVVFGPQFFPVGSDLAGRLAAFATLAIGFVARPLGGIVMGHFGDRVGRKSMLVWSLLLMGGSTFCIGLLPTYARIGMWAPALLIALRFVQGFAIGGEWGGAVLMSVEHAPRERRGLYGSFVAFGIPAGLILSNLVFLVCSLAATPDQFSAWAWRVPFLTSAILVLVGLFVRAGVSESPVFAEVRRKRAEREVPLLDVLRQHPRTVLVAAGSYLASSALGYVVIVFLVSYVTREIGVPLPTTLMLLVMSAMAFAIAIVVTGIWCDRIGRNRLMTFGMAASGLWSLILFPLVDTASLPLIGIAMGGLLVSQGIFLGPQAAVFAELFPPDVRYSGASLSVTLGSILGGAISPAVATSLLGLTGSSWPITAYLATLSLVSWLCARSLRETSRESVDAVVQTGR